MNRIDLRDFGTSRRSLTTRMLLGEYSLIFWVFFYFVIYAIPWNIFIKNFQLDSSLLTLESHWKKLEVVRSITDFGDYAVVAIVVSSIMGFTCLLALFLAALKDISPEKVVAREIRLNFLLKVLTANFFLLIGGLYLALKFTSSELYPYSLINSERYLFAVFNTVLWYLICLFGYKCLFLFRITTFLKGNKK